MIRVLIADDNKLWRGGVCLLLARTKEVEVIGQASDGKQAVDLALQLKPDVVLMDIKMPVMSGLVATRKIVEGGQDLPVLVLAMSYDPETVRQALESGARGYVAKHEFTTHLLPAIQAVHQGQSYYSPMVAQELNRPWASSWN